MSDETKSPPDFAHVRDAYGLIHAYHARLQDTLRFFVSELGDWAEADHRKSVDGFTRSTKEAFTKPRWAWDFIPFHTADIFYVPGDQNLADVQAGSSILAVGFCTDTSVCEPFGVQSPNPDFSKSASGRTGFMVRLSHVLCAGTSKGEKWRDHFVRKMSKLSDDVPSTHDNGDKGWDIFECHKFFCFDDMLTEDAIRVAADSFISFGEREWNSYEELDGRPDPFSRMRLQPPTS